jgi:hypothetical protein
MTANPRRRRNRNLAAAAVTVVLAVAAAVLVVVATVTLRDSKEGEAVGIDERPVVVLPATPNALVAVEGDEGELSSLIVVTLLPDGRGGTIVPLPVNADANAGSGEQQAPLDALYEELDFADFVDRVEGMLAIAIERAEVADADVLAGLIEPVVPIDVTLPEDVIDSSTLGTGIVATLGEQELRGRLVADVLTATDTAGAPYDHHDVDVAVWSALAANAPVPESADAARDASGDLVPPADTSELMQRLWEGEVQVRDLLLEPPSVDAAVTDESASDDVETGDTETDETGDTAPAETDAAQADDGGGDASGGDVVIIDRRDSLLVFAQISPAQVSTPNPALSFRLELGFTEEQTMAEDDQTPSDVARRMIGELLFVRANVVSVDMMARPDGAAAVTRIEVADERFLEDMKLYAPILFGESEVEVATTLIDGVDVVVTAGTGYFAREGDVAEAVVEGQDANGSGAPDSPDGTDVPGGTVATDD